MGSGGFLNEFKTVRRGGGHYFKTPLERKVELVREIFEICTFFISPEMMISGKEDVKSSKKQKTKTNNAIIGTKIKK